MHEPKVILKNVEELIAKMEESPYRHGHKVDMWSVCESLGIFDWWRNELSLSQLKQMRSFLKTTIKLGFDGYACFKVGAAECAHGMWANKEKSTTGFSPDGACIFHSFRSGDNYWGYCDSNNNWRHGDLTLKDVKECISNDKGLVNNEEVK